ncbi:MAG: hypothetical protein MHMPM18_001551 [Marteilia pararefringens]
MKIMNISRNYCGKLFFVYFLIELSSIAGEGNQFGGLGGNVMRRNVDCVDTVTKVVEEQSVELEGTTYRILRTIMQVNCLDQKSNMVK